MNRTSFLSSIAAWILATLTLCTAATAEPVSYSVTLDRPHTQHVTITVEMSTLGRDQVDLFLPVWRPGRYTVLEPAAAIRHYRASSIAGRELGVEKIAKATWRVDTRGVDRLRFEYEMWANQLGLRTHHVDGSHAFLSGSTVFVYDPEQRNEALTVAIDAPDGWRVATGLEPQDPSEPRLLTAPNYDVLVDSPIEVGEHELLEFTVPHPRTGLKIPHQIVIWPLGRHYDADRLTEDFATIVQDQAQLFGDMPYTRYVFLLHVGAGAGGGTEHLNSTIMQIGRDRVEASLLEKPGKPYERLLGLTAHEMFHTWNVKQLRPAGIQPYDYQNENYSELFWVSEGTTSYYTDQTLVRTALITPRRHLEKLSELIDSHRTRPGKDVQSVSESSFDSWIKSRVRSADDVNSTVSFYSKGQLVSLLLDLEILERTDGRRSFDDVMKQLYDRYPLSKGGFTKADLRSTIEQVGGGSFEEFFDLFVDGTAPLPLERMLETLGLSLVLEDQSSKDEDEQDDEAEKNTDPEQSDPILYLGLDLTERDGRTVVRSVRSDGPAHRSGLLPGDQIIAFDHRRLEADELEQRLELYREILDDQESVTLHVMRHDDLLTLEITPDRRAPGKWKVERLEEPSERQQNNYKRWSGQDWPSEKPKSDEDSSQPGR